MNISISKSALSEFIRESLREERSFHTKNIAEIPAKEEEEPIVPQEQMSVQLTVDAPPVEDPEFVPASISELAHAASVIARETPQTQIEFFYRELHRLLDRALDREEHKRLRKYEDDTGIATPEYEKVKLDDDLKGVDKDIESIMESIKNTLLEQDSEVKSYGDTWEPEEDWEKEEWEEIESTPLEEKLIKSATDEIISYLKPIVGDKTVINPFSGTAGQKSRGGLETFISLGSFLGPEKVDPAIAQIFSKYSLTPEQIKIVRYAVTQEMMKYKMHKGENLLQPWTDTNWCPSQLALNQAADQIALGLMRGKKDPETKEWIVEPMPPEDAAHYLIKRSECLDPETDQGEIDAHQEIAMMILNKQGAAEELRARLEAKREVEALKSQEIAPASRAKAAKEAGLVEKDLSDLWTQIAKEEGFASAAGARQFAFKPMVKYYRAAATIPPELLDMIISKSYSRFSREIRRQNPGARVTRLPKTSPEFRTYFKLIFFQPFVNDFLKVWKSQVGAILSELGIQDPKQVFAKMLVGETSPNSKSAKAKILSAMTLKQFSTALEMSREWAADPVNSISLSQHYAQRNEDKTKVANAVKKALSEPER